MRGGRNDMRLETGARAKFCGGMWTLKFRSDGYHGRVLAKEVTCSNLSPEGQSGSCVETGEGISRSWKTNKEAVVLVRV